ncbi:DUF742 domain-containing protein [Actinomadura sp. HBU206391]|uniref:DUF742 domain-containing protein n=1 Tax=Actinomadura sp. HBU206391 TaxID=2731692 RepID=UPI001650CE75|nr:DUF742 domain-containing protein [Actinomadura sp. HBU206391]MBC6459602.1 DUF742 domain-containing protein [Actinomadura sp. HBU206391]
MTGPGSEWLDDEAGPLVRSYALTRGRTKPATREGFEMIAIIATAGTAPFASPNVWPEHLAILELCVRPLSVAEISAKLQLPLVVTRVLLGDLLDNELIVVRRPVREDRPINEHLLREVLHGLEAL